MRKIGIQIIACAMILGLLLAADSIDEKNISRYSDVVRQYIQKDYSVAEIKDNAVSVMSSMVEKPKEMYASIMAGAESAEFTPPVDALAVAVFNQNDDSGEFKYMADEDIVVYSSGRGMVEAIEEAPEYGGYKIILKHDGGVETIYTGCTEVYVDELERIKKGQLIGCVSNEGIRNFTFELWENGEKKNPDDYLE